MASRRRKVEVHRLTISGDIGSQTYGQLIRASREALTLDEAVREVGARSHALHDATIVGGRLRLTFLSFTTGFRPDILDMADYSLGPNPLTDTQTGVEWTHCFGGKKKDRFLLLVERARAGISPRQIESYLQWLLHEVGTSADPIVVSLEPVADESFLDRIEAMDRIKRATVRIVRPNPGWSDLESDLGEQSAESDAGKSEVTMFARRLQSLRRNRGIIKAIERSVKAGDLDYAKVVGETEGQEESVDTVRYVRSESVELQLDENGQVLHSDAWSKLRDFFKVL